MGGRKKLVSSTDQAESLSGTSVSSCFPRATGKVRTSTRYKLPLSYQRKRCICVYLSHLLARMAFHHCQRLVSLSLSSIRPAAVSHPALIARSALSARAVSSSNRDAQHKVIITQCNATDGDLVIDTFFQLLASSLEDSDPTVYKILKKVRHHWEVN